MSRQKEIPPHVLALRSLRKEGQSWEQLAKVLGLYSSQLRRYILTQAPFTMDLIFRLSTATNSSPRYWAYLQSDWDFEQHLKLKRKMVQVSPIVPRLIAEPLSGILTPSEIIRRELDSRGITRKQFCQLSRISITSFRNLMKNRMKMNPLLAARLSVSLGRSIKYWLDIQSCVDFSELLKGKPEIENWMHDIATYYDRSKQERTKFFINKKVLAPIEILIRRFINPTKVPLAEWMKALGISDPLMNRLKSGRTILDDSHLIRICKAFGTKLSFWINIQNEFVATIASDKYKHLLLRGASMPSPAADDNSKPPGAKLSHDFLRPMKISFPQFARHIGLSKNQFQTFAKGGTRISFDLATRIGTATGTHPKYWFDLQVEYDIWKYENLTRNQRFI